MAVFVCAADESADQNPRKNFFYGGFSGPLNDWDGSFADAWNERVLNGPPQIPYLHMTSILSPRWREKYGLTGLDADTRLDEASRVIQSQGSLIPVRVHLDQADYDAVVRQPFAPHPNQVEELDPDYLCFLYFALCQLHWIYDYWPSVERVDFWVEENGKTTRHLKGFHARMADTLREIDLPHLADLVGGLLPVQKDRIPTQAADMLAWHARNNERGLLDRQSGRRYNRMVRNPATGKGRYGSITPMSLKLLKDFGDAFARRVSAASSAALEA